MREGCTMRSRYIPEENIRTSQIPTPFCNQRYLPLLRRKQFRFIQVTAVTFLLAGRHDERQCGAARPHGPIEQFCHAATLGHCSPTGLSLPMLLFFVQTMERISRLLEKSRYSFCFRRFLGYKGWGNKNQPLHEVESSWYKTHGRIYGRYEGIKPVLCVGELSILRRIFIKDFLSFPNRRDMKFGDPVMDNTLFFLEDEPWKRVRNVVTPAFTTSKLKKMMVLLQTCCDTLVENLTKSSQTSEIINCQEIFGGFVIKPILENPRLTLFCPILMKIFRMKLLNPETTDFYRNIIIQVLEERKNTSLIFDDFLQVLLDAEESNNNGEDAICEKGSCQTKVNTGAKVQKKGLSYDELVSQCVTFFIAGFDATTSLLSHLVYRLAMNQQYQENVYNEMNEALANDDGTLTYNVLKDMKYLDAGINECLRLCPAMVRSERRTAHDCVIENEENGKGSIQVKKGTIISIPVYGIHHDPEWYPEPEEFRPERFYDEKPPPMAHLPFGEGQRICVGMRFVHMQVKLCLAKILMKFQILPAPTTPKTLDFIEKRNILTVEKVEVLLKERSSS
ncbi:cytochrome P450 3A8 [Trichonephila inaurata madagascariensis]|uniref:Cytochrome P450 3A8 n=1 Tax=Trichonephila inaurata madagascariensis TaxID=2747483 RepID=A0A8X6XQ37_9ARAC|nr:cytochrome P450 3A8 [Trichonephila inaurata madagascariensis]